MKTEQQLRNIARAHAEAAQALNELIDRHADDNLANIDGTVKAWRQQAAQHIIARNVSNAEANRIRNPSSNTLSKIVDLQNDIAGLAGPKCGPEFTLALYETQMKLNDLRKFF